MTQQKEMELKEIPRRPEVDVCANCQRVYVDTHYEKDEIKTIVHCSVTHQIVLLAMRACQLYRPIRKCR